MLIEWKDRYSVKIDVIDEHHMKLFDMLNRSSVIKLQDNNQDDLSRLLYELINYAHYHFYTEEKLMMKYDYQNIDLHILEHVSFTNKVLSYERDLIDSHNNISEDVFDFVKNWLFDHIQKIDSDMGEFISSKHYV
ncbi:MAG: hemerythrin family protein [Desulfuromonadales bacterium]|nr:hemerythrin family protein [Desulfuromonadales bacterium]